MELIWEKQRITYLNLLLSGFGEIARLQGVFGPLWSIRPRGFFWSWWLHLFFLSRRMIRWLLRPRRFIKLFFNLGLFLFIFTFVLIQYLLNNFLPSLLTLFVFIVSLRFPPSSAQILLFLYIMITYAYFEAFSLELKVLNLIVYASPFDEQLNFLVVFIKLESFTFWSWSILLLNRPFFSLFFLIGWSSFHM